MNVTVARIYGWLTLFNVLLVEVFTRSAFHFVDSKHHSVFKKSILQRIEESVLEINLSKRERYR